MIFRDNYGCDSLHKLMKPNTTTWIIYGQLFLKFHCHERLLTLFFGQVQRIRICRPPFRLVNKKNPFHFTFMLCLFILKSSATFYLNKSFSFIGYIIAKFFIFDFFVNNTIPNMHLLFN